MRPGSSTSIPPRAPRPEFLRYASGAESIPGSDPVAMLYAGHQFGSFVPQLGDGRAILLGEVVNSRGDRWDLHLKGSGPTPFSRGFDGRSVLRSAIREYLCGEALHALGIPTTRALCVVGSSEPVRRETVETAASIIRMAPTHVRIGSFEVFASRGQVDYLRQLADYTIELHFPELTGLDDRYARMLETVARRTASLMAQWQAVGFVHGVMNTDNFSITGLTIDYGPYAFMEAFESGFIPNHSDPAGPLRLRPAARHRAVERECAGAGAAAPHAARAGRRRLRHLCARLGRGVCGHHASQAGAGDGTARRREAAR